MKKNILIVLTYVTLLLLFPNINFGQAPDLGSASGFALFTAAGAFSNAETTNITGNIGTNVGALTGFPPGIVLGQTHVADSVSAQAAIDVGVAYGYLSGITCDTVIGTTLGNGQVLTPNVYCMGAASTLNGNLILDGQGNPNALFIFKIDGALSTSISSNITLINSASLSNVYWQINGEFDLGDSSVFRGTVVVNGAINLLESSSLLGRGLSSAGAISLYNNIVAIPVSTLPVTFVSFNAEKNDANTSVNLSWQVASEFNNAYFLIERSTDGIYFEAIGKCDATNVQLFSYSFTDENPVQGINCYRLNQFDIKGTHEYSIEREVSISNTVFAVNIYPDPFTSSINISINNVLQINDCELKIYNASGTEVMSTIVTKQVTTLETGHLTPGIYFYKIINNNKIVQSGKLVSQR